MENIAKPSSKKYFSPPWRNRMLSWLAWIAFLVLLKFCKPLFLFLILGKGSFFWKTFQLIWNIFGVEGWKRIGTDQKTFSTLSPLPFSMSPFALKYQTDRGWKFLKNAKDGMGRGGWKSSLCMMSNKMCKNFWSSLGGNLSWS